MRLTPFSHSRRRAIALGACVLSSFIGTTAHAETQVVFASVGGLTDAGLYLADDMGFFRDAGLKVQMKRIANAPAILTSVATNQVDVGGASITPAMFTAGQQGMKLRVVGDKQSVRPGFAATRLVVAKSLATGTPDQMVQALRGKMVAVSAKAGSSYYNAATLLKEHGVGLADVKIKELSFPNMAAALTTGAIDGAYIIEPFLSEVVRKGIAVDVSNPGEFAVAGPARINVPLVYSEKFAADRANAEAFMVAYMKGVRVYNDAFVKNIDKEKVVEILARHAGVPIETVRDSNPAGLDPNQDIGADSFNEVQAFFVEQGLMKSAVPLGDLIDPSFAKAAVEKLGRYK
jgi:NitT/TauT family transport system substrate-binding protein